MTFAEVGVRGSAPTCPICGQDCRRNLGQLPLFEARSSPVPGPVVRLRDRVFRDGSLVHGRNAVIPLHEAEALRLTEADYTLDVGIPPTG